MKRRLNLDEGETYIGPSFVPGNSVYSMHDVPRFGYGREFAKVFSYNNREQVGYIKGLLGVTIILLMIFLSWGLLLSFFCCMDRQDVGFLGGYPFLLPSEDEKKKGSRKKMYNVVRVIFIISTLMVPLFATLFISQGIKNFETAIEQLRETAGDINGIGLDAIEISDNLLKVADTTIPIRDVLVEVLDAGFCPGTDILQYTGINFEEMTRVVQTQITTLSDFIESRIISFKSYAQLVVTKTNDFDSFLTKIRGWSETATTFLVPLIFLSLFFFVGAFLTWNRIKSSKYQFFQLRVIMPLFVFFIMASCIFSSLSVIIGALNADFCMGGSYPGSPEGTLLTILTDHDFETSGITYKAFKFYTGGCASEHPFKFINKYITELDSAENSVKELDENFQNFLNTLGKQFLQIQCPGQDFDVLQSLLAKARASINILTGTTLLALDIVDCSNINPIYVRLSHDSLCTSTVSALHWTFSSLLCVSTFGFIVIMFRSVLLPVEYDDDFDYNGEHDTIDTTKQDSYDYEVGKSDRSLSPMRRTRVNSISTTGKSDEIYRFGSAKSRDRKTWKDYESDDESV